MTRCPVPNVADITFAPDGTLWFTSDDNTVASITPTGALIHCPIPTASSLPDAIVAGPDGTLWFTEVLANQIGRLTR